ncbi:MULTISPECIES: molybdopterin oxidoreductase family protein [unclassified Nesterenkonia]|uniref:molybdopterin oxidoreductase family protein n=1 Tax=unclassified Nesterenkonia TaxID=2629769 RepID=UPI001F4CDF3F|nr:MULTISPECIES: molybdopterin oxidoreductase family protein [unclassified Nesterenkonia]MCH8560576.1 molybdopterin oxidoreductase family protein [Nesterenkonia sp. DZ6]MCH8562843.1 molybdopterin oxidoreductase family protein [Nesterenkonia sp. YGD6]MCH8570684.1 molybdopterin oxidoreductase family protein [Nesterenkonia sp. AY15]
MPAPQTTREVNTHCPYCALQCAMTLRIPERPSSAETEQTPPGITVEGARFPTNRGRLCRKGSTAAELLGPRSDRLRSPLIAETDDDGERSFRAASWEEALDHIAERLRSIQATHGPDAIGVFGSGSLTNEKTYALGKFARVALGTSQIDYNGRFCMSSAAKASTEVFGLDRGLPFPLTDLDAACTVLLLGSNVADTMPPFVQHLEGARSKGGLIVVDPRRSSTAELTADGAGFHVAPTSGGDLVLLLALANVLFEEGYTDQRYLADRVSGTEDFRRSAAAWWPERAQAATGVGADQIRLIARRLGSAAVSARDGGDPVFILTGRGVEQHRDGTDTARAAISLALVLGLPGARGGYGTLTGQGNGQGGREMGQKSDQLPGLRSISSPTDRAHIAEVWGVAPESIPGPGVPATQLLHTMGTRTDQGPDGIRALLVHGSNVAVSAPDTSRVLKNLRALDLLVVADFFLSETAAEADVVLPVLQWAEEDGTMTSLEGRLLRRRRALEPPSGCRSELWIFAELARRLGVPTGFSTDPAEVFEEIRRATAGATADYSAMSWELLDAGHAGYWPHPAAAEPAAERAHAAGAGSAAGAGNAAGPERTSTGEPIIGTPRMFTARFAHADGRATLRAIRPRAQAAPHAEELTFTTGRLMEHYQSGNQTRRVPALDAAHPQVTVQIHPATARQFGLAEDGFAVVENAQGALTAKVVFDAGIRADTLFSPFHFSGRSAANLLTRGLTDPHSKMPEFKNTPVRIRPATSTEAAA